ncbi:MAG TPA: ankyrin repeat domain-containing protein [Alphaproteobacteria bacterium]|nr:ankyrin repeat domain-containing protein [Alphaproteobacteria bacterium]
MRRSSSIPALLAIVALAWPAAGCQGISHPKDLKSVSITLERTRCYGTCPDYTVTLGGDGNVRYMGRFYVEIPGAQTAKIQPEQIKELLAAFDAIHFFELQDKYIDPCTDNPTEFISLSVDGKSKRIENYFCGTAKPGPQADLATLARQIDSLAGTSRWIKCNYECMTEQIKAGMNVNSRAPDGSSPLMKAVARKDLASVRLLLNSGAQTDVADNRSYTPLMFAAMGNSPEIVRELLAHGADANAKDDRGFGAVDMVEVGGEIYLILQKAGAKPHGSK